ncbi:MAG: AlkZ family DNA glycosylase [Solirubrobacterales bacterium]|nr:AlkZ family DNA glycosylase [Solirubrobacterales bacterium]
MSEVLSPRALNRATLARQLLLERAPLDAVEAVGRLGGLQAQEPRPPYLALWSRLEGFAREDLAGALREGAVVRGLLTRATLHVAGREDFLDLRGVLQPVLSAAMTGALRGRDGGLDLDALLPVARGLLEEEPRTFGELRALLAARFPGVDERALGYAVRTNLPLVMVPTADPWAFPRDARFAPADGRPRGAGPAGLVRCHLAAFGPATAADVQRWSGLKGLAPVLDDLRDELVVVRDERGRELFDLPGAPRPGEDAPAPPRFLPDFDSLVLAHEDRSRVVPDAHRGAITTRNLRVRATFLWDGVVAGTWAVARKGRRATLTVAPFGSLPRRAKGALTDEAERLLAFAEPEASSRTVVFAST